MKPLALLLICIPSFLGVYAQQKMVAVQSVKRPRLVVGLVVDQMRWDFLYRYNERYSAGGFKRLMAQGFSCENTMIPYLPTYTAVGHTSIYTGSVPAIHGIIGNYWFDKSSNLTVYCSDDSTVSGVGSSTPAGKMSPRNMWTTTITDELRLSNQFQSKVIGISLKDRGAIFPAGHSANAAYWYDDAVGKWISSTYYMTSLPSWVNAFNDRGLPASYMTNDWNSLYPIESYSMSTADDVPYETPIKGEKTATFPHRLADLKENKYQAFRYTPYSNTYSLEFAKSAIENEQLGKGKVTDFLAISLSTPDYIGHEFGPNSIEIEDTYLRLDRDISAFLTYLDQTIGKGNYLFFLSADHGVAHSPGFLADNKIPAGSYNVNKLVKTINDSIEAGFGLKKVVQKIDNYQVYLNLAAVEKQGINTNTVLRAVCTLLKNEPYIVQAVETAGLPQSSLPPMIRSMAENGYCPSRSGDIQMIIKPGYLDRVKGTTHGLWNPYDAHIPLVWFGWGIKKGSTHRETYMTDIAATLAALLKIQMPNGSVGKVITEVIK